MAAAPRRTVDPALLAVVEELTTLSRLVDALASARRLHELHALSSEDTTVALVLERLDDLGAAVRRQDIAGIDLAVLELEDIADELERVRTEWGG